MINSQKTFNLYNNLRLQKVWSSVQEFKGSSSQMLYLIRFCF